MPTAHVNGINLSYEVAGTGQPLVLIAGLGYSRWMWSKMIPGLAQEIQVISFDNRGVGESDQPSGPYTAQMMANDTAGLIEALGLEQAAVMGHSMGGFIAQALALSRPDLVSHLVLSATNYGGPHHIPVTHEAMAVLTDVTGDPLERFRRGLEVSCAPGFAEAHPEIIEEWLQYRVENPILPAPYKAQMEVGLGLLSEEASFEHKLKNISMPTLILFGEYDKVVPPGNAELLARELPDHKIVILPNAGHFFPLETPQAANAAILDFLKSHT